eukprot:CAMPEP_0197933838 /NCGR_PEP_ID=MMETSP1439-20131203/110798_1 /TAXON_ID=66791 /ORGANISM="Gonyaulax spinifera, Strain CCMP409" /LENGTH=38 /DNA_ID= /DNA_START= /DNA_END= /DNA_ORIENTATION=
MQGVGDQLTAASGTSLPSPIQGIQNACTQRHALPWNPS